tara:strand:+ start:74 stop:1024 length:951 start_codon:yes stop_codon:yes gene_type:complete
MKDDFYLSLFIIFVFLIITFWGVILFHFHLIRKIWPTIKCNPLVMPFASAFGKDPLDNFTDCVKNIQEQSMDYILSPLNSNINTLGGISNSLILSNLNVRKNFAFLRNSSSNLIGSSFGVFSNILIEFQKMGLNVRDTVGKLGGAMVVLMHSLKGSMHMMKSLWKGPPGDTLRALGGVSYAISNFDPFCFLPDTLLKLHDNTCVKMKDIKLGSILKNGSKVEGILKLNNLEENNSFKEKLYMFLKGENKTPIYVTGKHLVYINNKLDYVKNHPDAKQTEINNKELCCIITSDHTIPIGDYVFWDWEDSPEMTSHLK